MTGSDSLGGIKLLSFSKIDLNRFLYFAFSVFTIIVMFEPRYISFAMPFVHKIFQILKIADAAIIILLAFVRKFKFDSMIIWFLALQILLFISTLVNYGSGDVSVSYWFECAFYPIMLLFFLKIIAEFDYRILVNSFSLVLGSYVFINIFCWLLFPSGMYVDTIGQTENWFLGYDNVASVTILIAQMISAYRYKSKIFSFKIWDFFVIVIGAFFIFVQKVGTGILCEVILFAFIILSDIKFFRKNLFKAKFILIAFFLLFFLIQFVLFTKTSSFNFLLTLFNKEETFFVRIKLWKLIWNDFFSGNYLFGVGLVPSNILRKHFLRWAVHCHCYYLQILYEGGIASFLVFFGFLINSSNIFDRYKKTAVSGIILGTFAAILLMFQVEASTDLIRYSIVVFFFLHNANIFDNSDVAERLKRGGKIKIVARKSKKLA